ncbi:MAG: hypothetical protein K6F61_04085 [Clostridiales bacterium]|nr:hypothetical protein [Clostridiales bacterium]
MADIEKTLEDLKLLNALCHGTVLDDAIALLKEQQQRIEALEIDRDILVKDINTNNCNTCKRQCEHRPELGDVVRVNCFMWEGR